MLLEIDINSNSVLGNTIIEILIDNYKRYLVYTLHKDKVLLYYGVYPHKFIFIKELSLIDCYELFIETELLSSYDYRR